MTALIIRALYQDVGAHYNFLYLASLPTPFVLNIFLFSWNFEHAAAAQGLALVRDCRGVACYEWAFVTLMACNVAGFVSAVYFSRRVEGLTCGQSGALGERDVPIAEAELPNSACSRSQLFERGNAQCKSPLPSLQGSLEQRLESTITCE